MPTTYTSLLGLALPATGELSGTWGDTVNNYISTYIDAAVAGTQTITTDTTLTKTIGSSLGSTSSQYMVLLCSPTSANITITVPAASKTYVVINTSATYTVTIRGAGPTTGVTIAVSDKALVAWNGSDFVRVSAAANGSNTQVQYNSSGNLAGSPNLTFNGTTLTAAGLSGPFNGTVGAITPTTGVFTTGTFTTVTAIAAATQDSVILQGRAGGTSSYGATITPTTLTASRTLTIPDASGTILQSGTTVTVSQGGTGAATFTANNVLLGNGTSAFQVVAPGAAGNLLVSDGTTWASLAIGSSPAQAFITMATGGNQPPGGFNPSDSFALI
jgi:hypothetical protein